MESFEDHIELLHAWGVWNSMNNKQFPELIELHYQYRALYNRHGIAEQLEAEWRGLA